MLDLPDPLPPSSECTVARPQQQAGVVQRLGATEALVDPPGLEGVSPRDPGGVREVD